MADRPARTLVRDLHRVVGRRVRVCGWVNGVEGTGHQVVVVLRDHTGAVEVRGAIGSVRAGGASAGDLTADSAVEVVGEVAAGVGGALHVAADDLHVAGAAQPGLPIAHDSPLDDRLDWRYVDLRRERNRLIFAVQTTAEHAMRALWQEQGFLEIHSPKLRPIPNKSGDQLFGLEYFERRAWLAQSPQFYKQMAMAAGFDRVFEIGPVFRAQPDATPRHDTEFTSIDVELSWIDSHEDVMAHLEEVLCRALAAVADAHGDDIDRLFDTGVAVPVRPFPRMTLSQARRIAAAAGPTPAGDPPADGDADRDDLNPGGDLDAAGERLLAAHVAAEHRSQFVFVTDYPEPSRPFYHMRCDDRPPATRSFDLLYAGLEIASGAQREHRHARLVGQARDRGLPVDAIGGYLDFFRYGCPPHGGFGLGLTRMLVSMLGLDDVREATYLFRGPDRLAP